MKLIKALRRINYRHYLCLIITLGFVAFAIFVFPDAFGRLIESIKDFGASCGYYVDELFFDGGRFVPTVKDYSKLFNDVPIDLPIKIPENVEVLKSNWERYWEMFVDIKYVKSYLKIFLKGAYNFTKIMLIVLPFILATVLYFKHYFESQNNKYNKDSIPLKVTKVIAKYTYIPIKTWMVLFIEFIKENKAYFIIWVMIFSYAFNLMSIVIEFLAFYLYFVVSLDIANIYVQIVKLLKDLSSLIDFVPVFVWCIIAFCIFLHMRKNIAYKMLNHMERKNRGFINARPIVYMVCGTMGMKKTTTISDMALSQEAMLRDKAFEKILENDLRFPFFPWINLENALKTAISNHQVYNLATCRKYVKKKKLRWQKNGCKAKIFDYDYERYGLEYDDKLRIINVWETIENYAQLYFIYIVQSSLIISNYSIRTDAVLRSLGNFPMWNSGFFRRDSRLIDAYSRHSHILDFDSLRLGRKVVEDNKYKDSFEFGVINLTEIGKERGNNLENLEKKKKANETNQKNDLFNHWLKMVRHSATVDNYPFVKVITDEQRAASWGADARELCQIITNVDGGDNKLCLPFFALGGLIHEIIYNKFNELYYRYRYVRADNTLFMYSFKKLVTMIHSHYERVYNQFGYSAVRTKIEEGTQDGKIKRNYYYLMNKKIYSKRFSTDCYSDFFTLKALMSKYGIDDLPEYETEKATMYELLQQNSYFISDIFSGFLNASNDSEQN